MVNDESIKINGLRCVHVLCYSCYSMYSNVESKERGSIFINHMYTRARSLPPPVRTMLRRYRFNLAIKRIDQQTIHPLSTVQTKD